MKSKLKQIGKDSLIYGIGGGIAKGIGFFLLPIYTRLFTPEEYGTIEMLVIINSLLGAMLAVGLDTALSFYCFEQKTVGKKAQAQLVTAIVQWRLIWGTSIVLIATLFSPLINAWFFNDQLGWEYFLVAFLGALFAQFMQLSAAVFRLLYRPWRYIFVTLCATLGSAFITIILVIWLDYGILGYFIGFSVGSLIAALIGWWFARDYLDWSKWHISWWPVLLRFGMPLVPGLFAMFFLSTSDRWFINYYLTPKELGIYAVAAKIAMIITAFLDIMTKAFMPHSMDIIQYKDKKQADRLLEVLLRYFGFLFFSLVILLAVLSPFIISILAPAEYYDSFKIVGLLSLSSVFYGLTYFSSLGCWKAKKTYLYTLSVTLSFFINIALNWLFVPRYGLIGAAVATAMGTFFLAILSFYFSHKSWSIDFSFRRLAIQIVICLSVITLTTTNVEVVTQFGILLIALVLMVIFSVKQSELVKMSFKKS